MKRIKLLLALFIPFVNGIYAQKTAFIAPNSARQAESLVVSITGTNTNFLVGSNTMQFYYQGSPTNKVVSNNNYSTSNTQMVANLFVQASASIGAYTYKITNSFDGIINGSQNFYVMPDTGTASLLSIDPSEGMQGEQLQVLITGRNTHFSQASQTSQINFLYNGVLTTDVVAFPFGSNDDTHLQAFVMVNSNANFGDYTLRVTNLVDGQMDLPNGFKVGSGNSPTIVKLDPNIGHQNETLTVSVIGSRTQFSQASPTAAFFISGSPTTDIEIQGYQYINDSNVRMQVYISPGAQRGFYDFAYFDGVRVLQKTNSFEVTWPNAIEEKVKKVSSIKVYPNPTASSVHIESENNAIEKVEVYDGLGRLVQTELPEKPNEKVDFELGDINLPNQLVLLKIYTYKGIQFYKLFHQ
ncbi:MAG: T9SS type A sorting domain-containing protein [Bacteroidia bacterium]|nr:T9SS type A sorting domain-containing protein [Bacteroidia bacterium]MCF8447525.1 T9SS type A sorting domain-containing protein [Bacteroidia bacterium]